MTTHQDKDMAQKPDEGSEEPLWSLLRWLDARESSALVQKETAERDGTLRWVAEGRVDAYEDVRRHVEANPSGGAEVETVRDLILTENAIEAAAIRAHVRAVDGAERWSDVGGARRERMLEHARLDLEAALFASGLEEARIVR